ncbi:hypothetical protein EX349_15765 [Pseudomonas protegens]|nr:hypothetical protein [Pseudomonas sp. JV245A]NAN52660.1 hypothetical protein [Pseudomonas protegens]NUE78998.1 hypothetical protein [Pseudomonas protegens]
MSLQVERRHGRATDPGQWGQNEKTSAPGSLRASRARDVFVVGGATAVGYRCGADSKSRANLRPMLARMGWFAVGAGLPAKAPSRLAQGSEAYSPASRLLRGAGQPSRSCMAMICSATWISFCCLLMAWRRIRV